MLGIRTPGSLQTQTQTHGFTRIPPEAPIVSKGLGAHIALAPTWLQVPHGPRSLMALSPTWSWVPHGAGSHMSPGPKSEKQGPKLKGVGRGPKTQKLAPKSQGLCTKSQRLGPKFEKPCPWPGPVSPLWVQEGLMLAHHNIFDRARMALRWGTEQLSSWWRSSASQPEPASPASVA